MNRITSPTELTKAESDIVMQYAALPRHQLEQDMAMISLNLDDSADQVQIVAAVSELQGQDRENIIDIMQYTLKDAAKMPATYSPRAIA